MPGLVYTVKDDKLVANAALTQEADSFRPSDVTFNASSDGFSSLSEESRERVLDKESATRCALFKLECRDKNCSTAGCGLSSLAVKLNSEYVLQVEDKQKDQERHELILRLGYSKSSRDTNYIDIDIER